VWRNESLAHRSDNQSSYTNKYCPTLPLSLHQSWRSRSDDAGASRRGARSAGRGLVDAGALVQRCAVRNSVGAVVVACSRAPQPTSDIGSWTFTANAGFR